MRGGTPKAGDGPKRQNHHLGIKSNYFLHDNIVCSILTILMPMYRVPIYVYIYIRLRLLFIILRLVVDYS